MLANDWTLRNLVPDELAKSFGFFNSKPATAFSPFAVTPDELGDAWKGGRAQRARALDVQRQAGRRLRRRPRDALLVLRARAAHREDAAVRRWHDPRQRHGLERDRARGISCLAEARMIETIEAGKPTTPFMAVGDRIQIEATPDLFGAIDEQVVAP